MRLISACLLGMKCAWNGEENYRSDKAIELMDSETLIPVCPEQLGGLKVPRAPQEIQGGSGEDVLDGKCRVLNKNGEDVTREFVAGAEEALGIARQFHIEQFVGKSNSPSCGCGRIYDGTFSQKLIAADGVTTALLKRNGIGVMTEEEL